MQSSPDVWDPLTPEQQAAIDAFREVYTKARCKALRYTGWKEALFVAWWRGWDADFRDRRGVLHGAALRQLRNNLGPQWLDQYTPEGE